MKKHFFFYFLFFICFNSILALGQTPESGNFYRIKNINASITEEAGLYLTQREDGHAAIVSGGTVAGQLFFIMEVTGNKYVMEHAATALYLASGGANNWNTSFIEDELSANATFTFVSAGDGNYRIQGSRGYYASDNTVSGSSVYCDKTNTNNNGLWSFEEISQTDALVYLKNGMESFLQQAVDLCNAENPAEGTSLAIAKKTLRDAIEDISTLVTDATTKEEIQDASKALKEAVAVFNASVAEYYIPQAGKCYVIKNVPASTAEEVDLYILPDEKGEISLLADQSITRIFYVTKQNDGSYTLEHAETGLCLASGGASSWLTSFSATRTSNATYSFEAGEGKYYRIKGSNGYFAPDNTTTGSTIYCDKEAANARGLWLFEEASDEDVLQAVKAGLPAFIEVAEEVLRSEEPKDGSFLSGMKTQLENAIGNAKAIAGKGIVTKGEALDALDAMKDEIVTFERTFAAYLPLEKAIENFTRLVEAATFANKEIFYQAIETAQAVYDHADDQTANIEPTIETLYANREPLWAYRALNTTITNADRMLSESRYNGYENFETAVNKAKGIMANPDGQDIRAVIEELKDAVGFYLQGRPTDQWVTIKNGALWKDDRGETVQAHGAGFLQVGDTWYMIGEDRETAKWNPDINMYSSKDFVNWKFEGKIVANGEHSFTYEDGSVGALGVNRMIERPKLLYNEKTGQYVIWCHWEAGNYGASEAAVFYSDHITGPYTLHWAGRPLGIKSRDCNVFQDSDGKAYFVSTTNENVDLGVFELSDDYLDAVAHTPILKGLRREAPAIVRIGDQYNMLSSACSGWDPNQCQYTYSSSMTAGWSGQTNLNNKYSYDTQAASILTIEGSDQTTYLYVGDRWQDPDLAESKTIMFPIGFGGTSCTFDYSVQFDLNLVTGAIRETDLSNHVPKDNWTVTDCSSYQSGNEVTHAIDGNTGTIWHTRWDSPIGTAPHHITVDMGQEYEVSGFLATPRLDNDVNGLIREFLLYISPEVEAEADTLWTAVAGGAWMPYGGEIYFPAVTARYFKLVSLSGTYTSVAELDMLQNADEYVPMAIYGNKNQSVQPGSPVVFDSSSESGQGSWAMVGPKGFTATGRSVELTKVTAEDEGVYRAFYLNAYNQISTLDYTLTMASPAEYQTVKINLGAGVEMSGIGAGEHLIEKGIHLPLSFRLEDSALTAEDIHFQVNGAPVSFKQNGNNMTYLIGSVDKDYTIDLGLKEYSVTIPQVEGLLTDRAPGVHKVAFGGTFRFTVTLLDEAGDLSDINIYINDERIEPEPLRTLSFVCEIENITAPVNIRIEDANATSNAELTDAGIRLSTVDGQLIIETDHPDQIHVYDISGKLMAAHPVTGRYALSLNPGVYIVKTTRKIQKVVMP